jgi:hypothetical protein
MPLHFLKDHLDFVHKFVDDHINVNNFWEDGKMYETITDDNGDEHVLDTTVRSRADSLAALCGNQTLRNAFATCKPRTVLYI